MKKILFIAILFLSSILMPLSYAYTSGHIGLLTVSESFNNTEYGGTADLFLEVKPGNGRIFIDSFPLSKIDTQITMRFASEIACDLLERDCSNYDFFYTITASSAIVGGPSAGAAATVLTVALLDNQALYNDTIMTGTINSGNLIGPVAGIPAKTLAAQGKGYKRVLIPRWDIVNNTPDENLSIEVISVSTLEDALYYFTGKNYSKNYVLDKNFSYSKEYDEIMSRVTTDLCTKYGKVSGDTLIFPNLNNYNINISNATQNNFLLAQGAIGNDSYYSAASFCFGGNVKIKNALMKNLTNSELKIYYAKLLSNITEFRNQLELRSRSLSTISELETYMIVAERLSEAKQLLSEMNPENISVYQLAYAYERFDTAIIWSKFYELPGQKFIMDKDLLRMVCMKKLAEAEERLNYLELYYAGDEIRTSLKTSYDYYTDEDYALCIFTASIVKADSDLVLSAIFVPENDTDRLFDEKINAAQRVIAKQARANVFPILGYSYFEYANTLRKTDTYSSLLYAEYALELSNIDMYFTKREPLKISIANGPSISSILTPIFLSGFFIGALFTFAIILLIYKFDRQKPKKKKR
jgi:predicted S18 family serine protease